MRQVVGLVVGLEVGLIHFLLLLLLHQKQYQLTMMKLIYHLHLIKTLILIF